MDMDMNYMDLVDMGIGIDEDMRMDVVVQASLGLPGERKSTAARALQTA